ncbi:MAG: ABC transporter ATP-binding protein [Verrucomicrobia bacterium]|nr:ABC transporter ATP-binding protein [Verrucomicrobiota bacterium]
MKRALHPSPLPIGWGEGGRRPGEGCLLTSELKDNMCDSNAIIEVSGLVHCYGKTDAVNGLNLTVRPGRCYGFFGRNGAGKTTTIKCLLNLLQPKSGTVRLFGLDPRKSEVEVKSRLSYVPDQVAFYPWMTIQQHFEYLASFRQRWNQTLEHDLLRQFQLDPGHKVNALSKGEKVQVALIGALCPEPELLILDEPTSGLDPLVRREFIRTVIGAYQDADPGNRTVFVSTHLITEFEGLIDEFTVIEQGKAILNMETEAARLRFKKVRARFKTGAPDLKFPGVVNARQDGREVEMLVDGGEKECLAAVESHCPEAVASESLSLEEIFLAALKLGRSGP